MELLPFDAVALVCRHFDILQTERLLSTCRTLRAAPDTLFRALAVEWHGAEFWILALQRRTNRVFHSMRQELRTMYCFERTLARRHLPPWKHEDYFVFWRFEALTADKKALKKQPVHVSVGGGVQRSSVGLVAAL